MSLLSFFADQRRRWFNQLADYSAEYFAGAWAALQQAETAFMSTPLGNAHLEAQAARLKVQDTEHRLSNAQKQIEQLRQQLASATPHILAARQGEKDANRAAQHDRRQVALTRRALLRLNDVAARDEFEPEVRLAYIQNLICSHLALLRDENPDVPRHP
ncbi:hypothetical protein [Hymenobacter ruricola]|uniref:Uncharacterized protein n=1 Tax=Hymenobacter ruricola TaxID=2791023 RepID=A0ABS0I134_9BACT|nr:hypothetical protein [Hymenobacter ruricola]MBF9220640.1 hypothetical protein [Hymenobacter ruricola]